MNRERADALVGLAVIALLIVTGTVAVPVAIILWKLALTGGL